MIPLLVVVTVYAVVDAAMLAKDRVRGLPRPAWIVLIMVLPLVGLVLWFTIGRGPVVPKPRPVAPEDSPMFLSENERADQDARIRELEEQLLALDAEEQAAAQQAAEEQAKRGPGGRGEGVDAKRDADSAAETSTDDSAPESDTDPERRADRRDEGPDTTRG